jgi:hypothetical protein
MDLAFGERPLDKSAVRDALKFLRCVNEDFYVASPKVSIEIDQYPLEPVEIALFGILNQDEIDVALAGLPTLGKGTEQNGFADAVFLEYRSGAVDDVVDFADLTIHRIAGGSDEEKAGAFSGYR